jgi:hypothetical protein
MIQMVRWYVEAESEQEAINKVIAWTEPYAPTPGEDLVDIETVDTYGETTDHIQWFKESISCMGTRSKQYDD